MAKPLTHRIVSKLARLHDFYPRNLRLSLSREPTIQVLVEDDSQFNFAFFHWLEATHPAIYRQLRFTLSDSRWAQRAGSDALLLPWLRDPVRERDLALYQRVVTIEQAYAAVGCGIVNPVRVLSNARKKVALDAARSLGIRCADIVLCGPETAFAALEQRLGLPFIVRDDATHARPMRLVRCQSDFDGIDWQGFRQPAACEYIDTRGSDGCFRKYRYVLVGERGVPHHLIVSNDWCIRAQSRLHHEEYVAEEARYLQLDAEPHHRVLNRLRKKLELDLVAFDYGLDPQGQLVLWEPNPFPYLWDQRKDQVSRLQGQRAQAYRIFQLMLELCLQKGGLRIEPRTGQLQRLDGEGQLERA
ncbi:hypothetical protein [Ferrimonas pelagia]|uniref:ATP-grasp domain-containing protein n=1 Tax=Ferrimonas pelagia TaxID=1177826 RepID=A0ABP9EQJ9_9GAMM